MRYSRTSYETHYCHTHGCRGSEGVEVRWHPADDTDPGEYDRDSCNHCGGELFVEPIEEDEE